MNSDMLPLRGTTLFFLNSRLYICFVYSMYDMQKKKKNTSYDILYDMTS